jgi:integrase
VYSLAQWSDEYLDHAKNKYVQKTYDEKRLAFRQLFFSVKPTMEPAHVRAGVILKHFERVAKERSGCAANKDRKNLIAAWNYAVKYIDGWPRENPFTATERQLAEESPRYVPPVEDFWTLYDSLELGQDKVMLFAYLHTAARRGELFRLVWEEVDFKNGRIKLWTRKRKGGLEADWIPMTGQLKEVLLWWRNNCIFPESKNVFLCESTVPAQKELRGQPFVERQKWMKHICKRAGVKTFGVHAIRHLSASILDDAGEPIAVIQGILRHKSAHTTAKYLHSLRGMKVVLDDAFRRPQPPAPQSRAVNAKDRPDPRHRSSDRSFLRVVK